MLYYATDGENWDNNDNWLSGEPISTWYGVTTNRTGRYVLRLKLANNGLRGAIPPELGNLVNLEWLDLSNNKLRGVIPSELGDIIYLESLDLDGNNLLNGCLPEGSPVPYCTSPKNQQYYTKPGNPPGPSTISWDPVEGATHYKIYYNFSRPECGVDPDSGALTSLECGVIAAEVFDTSYVDHGASWYNYYWVVACNSDGCSKIDEDNPVEPSDSG